MSDPADASHLTERRLSGATVYQGNFLRVERDVVGLPDGSTATQPEFSFWFKDVGWGVENFGTEPTIEVDRAPPDIVIDKLLRDCGLAPEGLTVVLTPTTSLAGTTQVVARVLEVALHKAHTLGFALEHIVEGSASAPLPAAGAGSRRAMASTTACASSGPAGGRFHTAKV